MQDSNKTTFGSVTVCSEPSKHEDLAIIHRLKSMGFSSRRENTFHERIRSQPRAKFHRVYGGHDDENDEFSHLADAYRQKFKSWVNLRCDESAFSVFSAKDDLMLAWPRMRQH